jgi:hypothetical protein
MAMTNFNSLMAYYVLSRVTVRDTALYIGRIFLVSVILMWPAPKIGIFGVGHPYVADNYDYWYRLY